MREGWEYKKLGEVCEILNGFAFKSSEYVDSGIRVMRITNVQKGAVIDDDPKFYPIEKQSELKKYLLYEGDLLMSLTGNVGRVGLLPSNLIPAGLNQRVACLRLKGINVNKKYLFHLLNSDIFETDCIYNASGIAQKNMSTEWLRDYLIPVPPLSEQQRIVSELDLLTSIIDKQKAQLKELDTLAQSIFYDMFGDPVENEKGWEVKKLEEVCSNIVDCPHSTPKKADGITEYPCIRTSELKGGAISWDTMQYLEKDEYEVRIARLKPIAGDIVFGREGSIGDAVILPIGYFFSLGQRTMLLRANKSIISNVYLHRVILSEWVKSQIASFNVSSTVAHVNIKDFKQFDIPLPPLSLQQSFAAKIEAIEKQKAAISQSIVETQKLFDYTMDKYFG